ncbi:DNA gyrase subunit A [Candidatus Gracilibacteria bacterium]|nr:DNA gyrase subunit A [Candidatus Gracilibacteria bacterium]
MQESYLAYAMSVIKSRALPDVRDGLKPVHRRILFAMHKMGITPGSKFVKSARVVGEVIGKYHPHGDSSVYEAMVRLAQDFSMRYPLVKGQGNFGSIDGDSAAAMRYTEAKMEKITPEILDDLDKETVRFQDNYDGSFQEPSVLPTKIPGLLMNGSMGIAVGMATNIPPHNLGELCNAIIEMVSNPEISIDELLEIVKGPDFPTAGVIYDIEKIKETYKTGRGSIVIRGKANIEENEKTGKQNIIITELPYQVNKANLILRMADLVREKTITGIAEIRDESNKEGIRIFIGLKKDAFGSKILNQLYQLTNLQTSFGMNMIALVEKGMQPKLLNLKLVLEEFIGHRFEVITNRTKYDLKLAEARKHILDGLKKALDSIDAIIKTIRASKTKEEAKTNLIAQFDFTEIQADAILAMRLQTLAGLERQKIEDELKLKIEIITDLKDILAKPERVNEIIVDETDQIKEKFANPRRTEIVAHGLGNFDAKALVPNLDMIVTISKKGYIKRMPVDTYSSQNKGGKGVKGNSNEEDMIINVFHAKNHDELLFFTDNGRCFKLNVYEIPQASRIARGQALVNFLNLGEKEQISTVLNFSQSDGKFIVMATLNGTIKKTDINEFANVRRSGLIAAKVKPGNLLKWVKVTNGEMEISLVTKEGKSIRFSEKDVRSMGRTASGVRGIKLKDGDEVIEMDCISPESNSKLMNVMENGLSKMTDIKEYRLQSRGGTGVKVANLTAKTGKVAGAKIIQEGTTDDRDLLLMSQKGITIRMPLSQIKTSGRSTQGVIIMRMKEKGDKVASVSLIPNEEKVEENLKNEK